MSAGFYKRRRGILEHLESGKIGLLDLAVHDFLNLKANLLIGANCAAPPGVCFSSAVAIHSLCPREVSERAIRRSLEHLEKIGWIKRWQERGKRGNYPILVCRASVHDVSAVEYRVNGLETTDWRNPVLIPAADRPHSGPMLSGNREKKVEKSEKPQTGAAAPLADLPVWIPEPTWKAFSEMRANMRAPLTPHACLLIFKKLASWMEKGQSPQEVLEQSIENGWRAIYELKKESRDGRGPLSADEAQRRTIKNFGIAN